MWPARLCMLPATQKGWADSPAPTQPTFQVYSQSFGLADEGNMQYCNFKAICQQMSMHTLHISTLPIDHRSNIKKFTYTWYQAHTSKAHALFPQTAIGVIQTQLSKLRHFQCSRGETGCVEKGSTHTSAQRYVMDNIWNDSPGPCCRPGTTLPGPLSPPTSHDRRPGVQLHPACLIRIHVLSCRRSNENLLQ